MPDTVTTYATDPDVLNFLGQIRNRLPEWIGTAELRAPFLEIAHSEVVDSLAAAYPQGVPSFTGAGRDVVRYAEAKLAAAQILDAVRVNLSTDQLDAPDRLRSSAFLSLEGGVAGYLPDTEQTPTPGGGGTGGGTTTTGPRPRVSSYTSLSAFPDPYEGVRDYAEGYVAPEIPSNPGNPAPAPTPAPDGDVFDDEAAQAEYDAGLAS